MAVPFAFVGLLAGCGGGDNSPVTAPTPTPVAPAPDPTFAQTCASLQGLSIDASNIALPTRGAIVGSVTFVAAVPASATAAAVPEHCEVKGAIQSVDATAPPINFQVNLPTQWNKKAMQLGGGGMDGSLVNGLGNVPGSGTVPGKAPIPTPLSHGYATFGSDSGHIGGVFDGTFALNDTAFNNFAGGEQLPKTRDAAQFIMKTAYGSGPTKQYFAGGSQGGHEAFQVAQKWPDKYDGIIAYYPVLNYTGANLSLLIQQKALYGNGATGWFGPAKQTLLRSSALAACDSLDGSVDGIISNPAACTSGTTPAFSVSSLRCPGGVDTGDTCLSDAQIGAINVMATRQTFNFSLNSGVISFPGWPILLGSLDLPAMMGGPTPSYSTTVLGTAVTNLMRFFIAKDASVDVLSFNPDAYASRIYGVTNVFDALTTNLDSFRNRGGKILWVHGTVDYLNSGGISVDYWGRLTTAYTDAGLRSFARFYYVPGYGHGSGAFNASWDSLPVLEQWVESGSAPAVDSQTVSDSNTANSGRTRPLCDYPKWPKYSGTGDINAAASYVCVTS